MSDQSIVVIGTSRACEEAAAALASESWPVTTFGSLSALGEITLRRHDVIVLDFEGSAEPLWQTLEQVRARDPEAAILLLVPPETKWSQVQSSQLRPVALVTKPLERTSLLMALDSALGYRRLLEENRSLKRQLRSAVSPADWVGCTPESQVVRESITTAAMAVGPVVLLGEDGTGRRLAAELIHRNGRNPGSGFLPVDLRRLPTGELRTLIDEVREASSSGRLDFALGARPGTLYLSELTALGRADQATLHAVVGEALPFRLIASADPSIHEAVRLGRFDPEVFGALEKSNILIHALRDRRSDVPVLIDHFLKRFCSRFDLAPLGIPSSAIEKYTSYDWPGNVAELSMVIERAVSIASAAKFDGTTLPEHFCAPPSLSVPEPARLNDVSLREIMADIEKRIILQTLDRVDGSQKKAAERLRLNRTTLHEKMKRYEILPERARAGA